MLMNEATNLLLAKLDRACQSERSIDVHAAFKHMTMQVVGTTAFGCAGLSMLHIRAKVGLAAGKQERHACRVDFTMTSLGAEAAEIGRGPEPHGCRECRI